MPIPRLSQLISLLLLFSVVVCPIATPQIDLDSIDDCINFGDQTFLDGATSWAMYVVWKQDTLENGDIFAKWQDTSSQYAWIVSVTGTNITLGHTNSAGNTSYGNTTTTTLQNGQYYKLVWNGNLNIDAYEQWINGVSQAFTQTMDAADGTGLKNSNATIVIGSRGTNGAFACEDQWNEVDIVEVAVWKNTHLTDQEAQILSNSNIKGIASQIQPSTLVFHCLFNSGSDGSSADGTQNIQVLKGDWPGYGIDGANNTGCTWKAETVLSYPGDE